MPKIIHIAPSITEDVDLLYPNQSGTIGRLSDITGTSSSITRLSYSQQTATNIVLSAGFWTACWNFGSVTSEQVFRAIFHFRCNRTAQNGTSIAGQWLFRLQYGDTLDMGYPTYNVPNSGGGLYDWGTMTIDFQNPTTSSLPILTLYASRTSGGGVNGSAQARLTKITYF